MGSRAAGRRGRLRNRAGCRPRLVGPARHGAELARELSKRIAQTRAASIDIKTIVLADESFDAPHDVAMRNGIVAIRTSSSTIEKRPRQPQSLRFGLWSMPVGLRLPSTRRWFGGSWRSVRSQLDQAIAECGVLGVAIDVRQLAERGRNSLRLVERFVQLAAEYRAAGARRADAGGHGPTIVIAGGQPTHAFDSATGSLTRQATISITAAEKGTVPSGILRMSRAASGLLAVRAPAQVGQHAGTDQQRDIHRRAGAAEGKLDRQVQCEHQNQQPSNNHS